MARTARAIFGDDGRLCGGRLACRRLLCLTSRRGANRDGAKNYEGPMEPQLREHATPKKDKSILISERLLRKLDLNKSGEFLQKGRLIGVGSELQQWARQDSNL